MREVIIFLTVAIIISLLAGAISYTRQVTLIECSTTFGCNQIRKFKKLETCLFVKNSLKSNIFTYICEE